MAIPKKYTDCPWMHYAMAERGVAEAPGPKDNPSIMAYYTLAGFPGIQHETTAWCAAFSNAMLAKAGYETTGSLLARSFLKAGWGFPPKEPEYGDIVVFKRTNNPALGHVGFFLKFEVRKGVPGVLVLNGNVNDKVCESWFPKADVLGYRVPLPKKTVKPVEPEPEPAPAPVESGDTGPMPTIVTRPPSVPEVIEDLKAAGSRTINGADRIGDFLGTFTKWSVGLGVAKTGIDTATKTFEDIGTAGQSIKTLLDFVVGNLWLVVPLIAFVVAYELKLIKFARADDALTGKNTART